MKRFATASACLVLLLGCGGGDGDTAESPPGASGGAGASGASGGAAGQAGGGSGTAGTGGKAGAAGVAGAAGAGGGGGGTGGASTGGGGSGGSGGAGGAGGKAGASTGGSAGTGGKGGASGGGAGSSGVAWEATPEWTSLPIPLNSHPAIVAHPSAPTAFGILAQTYEGAPPNITSNLSFGVSGDLGTSFVSAKLQALTTPSPPDVYGLAWTKSVAAAFVYMPKMSGNGWTVFTSKDGGTTFAPSPIFDASPTIPPATGMTVAGGASPELVFRKDGTLLYSEDGTSITKTLSFGACTDPSIKAVFDVSPTDHAVALMRCSGGLSRCEKGACVPVTGGSSNVPPVVDVRFSPDGARAVAIGTKPDGAFVAMDSSDGGKTFTERQVFQDNVSPSWRVAWDPRPGKAIVYALLVSHLFRSLDGGTTWEDVTPPVQLNYVYDLIVLSSGVVVAQGVFHYLVAQPPP